MTVDQAAAARRRRRQRSITIRVALIVIFAVGVLPVALDLSRRNGLYGLTEYDDGVYFGASLRLVSGIFPYKDFVFVQPPGITVVLAPFAALAHIVGGRHALAGARILTAIVTGTNAALVGYLLRRRGLFAVAVGGLAFAVFPTGYTATHTFLLEPYCVLFCLVGIVLLFAEESVASPRRVALAGACFGFAGAIKVFAIVPILVALVLLLCTRRRLVAPFLGGITASVGVFVLPFLIAAPGAFVHDVIASQLGRSTVRPTPFLDRLFALTGLAYASPALNPAPNVPSVPAGTAPTAIAGAGLLAIYLGVATRLRHAGERSGFVIFALAAAAGAIAIALVPAVYYDHYAYFTAPFLALVLGLGACAAASGARSALGHISSAPQRRTLGIVVGLIAALAVTGGTVGALLVSGASQRTIVDRFGDKGPEIAGQLPPNGCTLTDAESLLVSAGRAGISKAGCPAIVDPTGLWLSVDPLHPPVRAGTGTKDPQLVAIWRNAFDRAEYVVFSGACPFRIPWTPSLAAYFDTHFSYVPGSYQYVFRREPPKTAAEQPTIRSTCAATDAATNAAKP